MAKAIYDNNGTTSAQIKKIYDYNGTTATQLKKGYEWNGTAATPVYEDDPYTIREHWYTGSTSGSKPYLVREVMNKTTVTSTTNYYHDKYLNAGWITVNYGSGKWKLEINTNLYRSNSYDMSDKVYVAAGSRLDHAYNATINYYFVQA